MTEQEIAKALGNKFFRGPSNFYQNAVGVKDEPDFDQYEKIRVMKELGEEKAAKMLSLLGGRSEQIEKESESSPVKWRIPMSICIDAVCIAHTVSHRELIDRSVPGAKASRLVAARQHAAWLIKAIRIDTTFQQIATRLNYKDHTTVMYSVEKFESVKTNYIPEIAKALEVIREKTGDKTICLL